MALPPRGSLAVGFLPSLITTLYHFEFQAGTRQSSTAIQYLPRGSRVKSEPKWTVLFLAIRTGRLRSQRPNFVGQFVVKTGIGEVRGRFGRFGSYGWSGV